MGRLAQTDGLTDVQQEILAAVRDFVDNEIIPNAQRRGMLIVPNGHRRDLREMGIFRIMIPEEWRTANVTTYALCVEEIAAAMSVSGVINTHFIVAYDHAARHGGTKQHFLHVWRPVKLWISPCPSGWARTSRDTSKALHKGDDWVLNGQKMWLTNGGSSTLCAVLVRTDEDAPEGASVYKKMSTFLIEKPAGFGEVLPGLTIPGKIDKMGYKGVDTTELVMEDFVLPADALLGGEVGKGFYQMMDGVEVGRVNVAARACGLANRAFELGVDYAQQRVTFGKPIAEHQAVAFRLAEMATKVEAAHLMMVKAARMKDSGERNDLEAGMAKYLASEYCKEVVEDSFRIHGGYGYSKEYEIERLYREAPMLMIGEGTADIQRMIIARRLLEDYKLRS
jgi:hypothetical protein